MRDLLKKILEPFFPAKLGPIKLEKIPQHIAIIMDGNGRWAKQRSLPRVAGHHMGAESVRAAVKACGEFKIKYLTLYAFSTENWQRPKEEVSSLMELLSNTIDKELSSLVENKVRIRFFGRISQLSSALQEKIKRAETATQLNNGLNLNIMLNYGSRAEIVDAVNRILSEGKTPPIDEAEFSKYLYTADLPDPDLLIRTANEMRISNFLLWQLAYAEIYVTDKYWPEFNREEMAKALMNYQKRERRFGRV